MTTMQSKKIHKLAVELSQSPPGSKEYLRSYGVARSQIERELSDNLRQSYKAMAKEWSEKKLPQREQQRYVFGRYGNGSSKLELADISALV